MPRTLRYTNAQCLIDFHPLQMQPRELFHQGSMAVCEWLRAHALATSRLPSRGASLVIASASLEFLAPLKYFDTDGIDVEVSCVARRDGTQVDGDVRFFASGAAEPAARVGICTQALWVANDAELSAVPARLPPSVLNLFQADEHEAAVKFSAAPARAREIEAAGRPVAELALPFTIYRHNCEFADQWYFADALGFTGACRDELAQRDGEGADAIRRTLGQQRQRIEVSFLRPFYLFDRGVCHGTAFEIEGRLALIYRLWAEPREKKPHALIVEEFASS